MQDTCTGEKSITLIYYQGFLYSKAIITSQSRCHSKGLLIRCPPRNSRRMPLWQEMEMVKEKEALLRAGAMKWKKLSGRGSTAPDTQGVFSFTRGAGTERTRSLQWASEREEGRRQSSQGREKGSSAPDQDPKESNAAKQRDLGGICFWV